MKTTITRRLFFFVLVVFASNFVAGSRVNAFDSFYGNSFWGGFNYVYSYRLPTPPYFSIYPPVYYGRRYERPYGVSPFASESLLGGNPSYHIRPKQTPVQWAPNAWSTSPIESNRRHLGTAFPLAAITASPDSPIGKKVTILNPFVHKDTVVAGK